jgi:nucleotide-binding universal stress UspA family protein
MSLVFCDRVHFQALLSLANPSPPSPPIMQILCATDFSPAAMSAADIGSALAIKWSLPLRLVHCAQDDIVMGDLPVVVRDDQPLREKLDREAQRLRGSGVQVHAEFRCGKAIHEILSVAAAQSTRLIVLGSADKSRTERWLFGSVAEGIAENAAVPTLIIRQPGAFNEWLCGSAVLRVLCGDDSSASSAAAMASLRPFLALGNVEIEAVQVRPDSASALSDSQRRIHQEKIRERVRSALGEVPVKVNLCHSADHPEMEFLHQVTAQSTGLIVLGSHQRHGMQRLLEPSFSRSVLTHAGTNVLCVPFEHGRTSTHIPGIHRLLVALNFTPVCTEALRYAHSLLPFGGSLHLVHVCQEPKRGINPVIASEVYFDHSFATAAQKKAALEKMRELPESLLSSPQVAVTTEVLTHENPAAALCEAAERFSADVICMGSKGHSRTGAALLGSTVQGVLARAHIPVFVATRPLL